MWFRAATDSGQVWTFQTPDLTLHRRQPIANRGAVFVAGTISAVGQFAGWRSEGSGTKTAYAFVNRTWRRPPISTTEVLPTAPALTEDWLAFSRVDGSSAVIHVYDTSPFEERARIELEGSAGVAGVRFQGERLVVFDGCGRLLVFSLRSGALVRDYRVS